MTDPALVIIIGQNVAKYRTRAGLTQEALSEAVDVSTAFISQVERGQKMMKVATLKSIAQALHVSCDALLSPESPEAYRENILQLLSQQSPEALHKIERVIRFCVEEFGEEPPASLS